jgi:alpha-ribazole phosphatase
MKIYLLRHAQSISNESNLADSIVDSELSLEGQRDVNRITLKLRDIKPDVFFVSPLKRTHQTIQSFLETLKNPIIVESNLLLERNLGDFTGTPIGSFQRYCDENHLDKVNTRPPNGESLLDVYNKVSEFLEDIKNKYSDKKVLVCGSKNNLMCLQILIEGKDISDYYSFQSFKTGELRSFELN